MSDYFAGPVGPPTGPPSGPPTGPPVGPTPSGGIARRQASRPAVGIVISALMVCIGACAPWIHASAAGESFNYSGLHHQLDGRWLLVLGGLGVAVGMALLTPRQEPPRELLTSMAAVVVVLGIVGLVVVVHQHHQLSRSFGAINDLFGGLFGFRVEPGWGMWLAGLGCVGLSASGVLAFLI